MREILLNKTNYIHLLSGGLDSAYSLLKKSKELKNLEPREVIHPIFFDYGQYAIETEWTSVKKVVKYVQNFLSGQCIIDEPVKISLRSEVFQWSRSVAFWGNDAKDGPEIENRNLVLFSVLASYLIACSNHQKIAGDVKFVITSGFKEKELPDCNKEFFDKFSDILNMYKGNMKFKIEIMKNNDMLGIMRKIKELLDGDESKFTEFRQLTSSCYSPNINGKPCGLCPKCKSLETEKIERSQR